MKHKTTNAINKIYKYILWAIVAYVGILTGFHVFKIVEYFIKPISNPLMPLDLYKYIAFPQLSFIPFLLVLLFLGIYFIRKEYYKRGNVIFFVILILIFHLSQDSLFNFFNSFNPYRGW